MYKRQVLGALLYSEAGAVYRWVVSVSVVLRIPRRLYEKAAERGIDIESRVIELLLSEIKVDPAEEASIRIELAERFLDEAEGYLGKGDPVQASEKMYKVVEECIKALARLLSIPEYQSAVKEGRWWIQLLGKAARSLARMLSEPRVEFAWAVAYDLHVWGFHEAKYSVDDIRGDLDHVRWILSFTKKLLEESRTHKS